MTFQSDNIVVTAVGSGFNKELFRSPKYKKHKCTRYNDAVHLELPEGELWLVDYGVMVSWGLNEETHAEWITEIIEEAVDQPLDQIEEEKYTFILSQDQDKLIDDVIQLRHDDILHRLAVVQVLAQSIKLNIYEKLAQNCIIQTRYVPKSLAKNGKIGLSRKQIACQRGLLFSVKSDIVLNYGLLDTPEFFWDHPELEPFYKQLSQYMEIQLRVNLLEKKVETIHELFEMLADEQKHRHSSFLEWLIIILIAIDIAVATIPKVFM